MKGQIYKVHTDSYSVKYDDKLIKCGARGLIKKQGDGILVGDFVEFENKTIVKVLQRQNRFIRPSVANIELIVAVVSPEPKPDFFVLDKLYLNAVKEGVEFIIVANKSDVDNDFINQITAEYGCLGVEILQISTKTLSGISELKDKLKSKLTVLAGQSAVGKTSLVNAMFNLDLKVGELSDKIQRGKHTTTRSEIFEYQNIKLVDTPGFAVIDAMVEIDELPECYPEYFEVSHECKFRGCSHINEPNCKVKELVNTGKLSKKRYERYVEIYNDILKRRNIYEKN
ncbi:MAG: ribosome small subunit-dependent GTPase A [Clostridia bacterium]|nr:ribosome small subunit-dependent GTPase A [Clostridia bacterium]